MRVSNNNWIKINIIEKSKNDQIYDLKISYETNKLKVF